MPCPFHISQTSDDVDDSSSISTDALDSFGRPITDRRIGSPAIRIADTIPVIIPKGAIANMKASSQSIDSERYCLVTCSPKREMIGAKSLPRLFVKSSHPSPSSLAAVAAEAAALTGGRKALHNRSHFGSL